MRSSKESQFSAAASARGQFLKQAKLSVLIVMVGPPDFPTILGGFVSPKLWSPVRGQERMIWASILDAK